MKARLQICSHQITKMERRSKKGQEKGSRQRKVEEKSGKGGDQGDRWTCGEVEFEMMRKQSRERERRRSIAWKFL